MEYTEAITDMMNNCKNVLVNKHKEYATNEDDFYNFNSVAFCGLWSMWDIYMTDDIKLRLRSVRFESMEIEMLIEQSYC